MKQTNRMIKRALLSFALLILAGCLQAASSQSTTARDDAIRPDATNPRYWTYKEHPVLLVGGSKEDNLFQISNLEAHLDQMVAAGGNYVRNTMSARDEGNLWAFHQRDDGTYDLERPNEAYYQRLEQLLRLAHERDIIVQIELWDRFDFARDPWLDNPFRPANNVNYTPEESGLANQYPEHPGSNNNPFFRSVPAQSNNQLLLRYQHARIERLLNVALEYPNVLYVMDNETSANPDWGAYWAQFIEDRAEAENIPVQVTEMWDDWDLRGEQHRRTLDHPERYDFADISQNNHNTDQEHWDNLQWVRQYTAERPWTLNNVKIYGADTGPYGTSRDAVERFWRNIIGGAASARFHRPPAGMGLSDTVQAHLRSARAFTERFDLFAAQPDAGHQRLSDRSPDEAYVSYIPGEQYAVYFTDGGAVQVDVSADAAAGSTRYRLDWLHLGTGQWRDATNVDAGPNVSLTTPGEGGWIALLTREE